MFGKNLIVNHIVFLPFDETKRHKVGRFWTKLLQFVFFLWCNSATTNICSIILNISNHLYAFFGLNHIMIFHPSKFRKCGQKNKRLIFVLFPNGVQKFSSILNIRFFKVFTFFAKDKYVREQKEKEKFLQREKKSEKMLHVALSKKSQIWIF